MRLLLRLAPFLALHVACSVYDESMLLGEKDGPSTVGGGGSSGSGSTGGSDSGGSGGTQTGGGSGGTTGGTGGSGGDNTGGASGGADTGGSGGDETGGTGGGGATTGGTGGSTGGTGGSTGGTGGSTGGTGGIPGLIEDLEDGNNRIKLSGGGYWFTSAMEGTCIVPHNPDPIIPVSLPEARGTSTRAMHFVGTDCPAWGAQGGFGLKGTTDAPLDSSMYSGISFWARLGSATSDDILNVEFSTTDTVPSGGLCDNPNATTGVNTPADPDDDCYGNYMFSDTLTTTWKEIQVPFADLSKSPGYGPDAIDTKKLVQIIFSWKLPTNDFDVWIDDIKFYE